MKKKNTNKKPINKWKVTAIISLIINALVGVLFLIGSLGTPPKVKSVSATSVYNTNNIVVQPNNFSPNAEYYLYFDFKRPSSSTTGYKSYVIPYQDYQSLTSGPTRKAHFVDNPTIDYSGSSYRLGHLYISRSSKTLVLVYNGSQELTLGRFSYSTFNGSTPSYFDFNITWLGLSEELFSGKYQVTLDSDGYVYAKTFTQYSIQNLYVTRNTKQNLNHLVEIRYLKMYSANVVDFNWLNNWLIQADNPFGYLQFTLARGLFRYQGYNYTELVLSYRLVENQNAFFGTAIDVGTDTIALEGTNLHRINVTSDHSNGYFYMPDYIYLTGGDAPQQAMANRVDLFKLYRTAYDENSVNVGQVYYSTIEQIGANFRILSLDDTAPYVNYNALARLFNFTNAFQFSNYDGVVSIDTIPMDDENTITGGNELVNVFTIIRQAFESLVPILAITIVPGLSVGLLIFIPIVLGIIIIVFKMVKK